MTDDAKKPAATEPDKNAKVEAAKPADKHEGLVKVKNGDETLHVHPSAVKAHEDAGWVRA